MVESHALLASKSWPEHVDVLLMLAPGQARQAGVAAAAAGPPATATSRAATQEAAPTFWARASSKAKGGKASPAPAEDQSLSSLLTCDFGEQFQLRILWGWCSAAPVDAPAAPPSSCSCFHGALPAVMPKARILLFGV